MANIPNGSKVQIVCRAQEFPNGRHPMINGIFPDYSDVEVSVVLADGTRILIPNVTSIEWTVQQGSDLPRAKLTIDGAEVDVEGTIHIPERR